MSDKSIGQWVGAIVGTVIGYFTGNVALGYAIGTAIGGYLDPPKGPTIEGPRLQDLNVQLASLGAPMGRIYGTVGLQGNVIWVENNKIKEVVRKQKQGGKGGGGSTVKTYSYFGTFAVALCEGPVDGIRRVWVGNDLVYNSGATQLGTIIASNGALKNLGFFHRIGYVLSGQGNKGVSFSFYNGAADQDVDPRIEADLGVGKTPAFRGTAYIVFYDLPLERYGNTLLGAPVKVEVIRNGNPVQPCEPAVEWTAPLTGTGTYSAVMSIALEGGRIYNRVDDGIEIRSTDGAYLGKEVTSIPEGYTRIGAYAPNNPRMCLLSDGDNKRYILARTAILGPLKDGDGNDITGAAGIVLDAGSEVTIAAVGSRIYRFSPSENQINLASEFGASSNTGATISGGRAFFWSGNDIYAYAVDDLEFLGSWNIGTAAGSSNARPPFGVIGDLAYVRYGAFVDFEYVLQLHDDGSTTQVCMLENRFHANLTDDVVFSVGSPAKFFSPGIERGGYEILGNVVRDELERSELIQPGDIDSSELLDEVRGYRIAGVQQIRAVLSPLQGAYPFDLIPSGYQIKAVRRGKASVKTIPVEELDARAYGSEAQPMLEQSREMDSQLPRKVTLRYLDASREYEINEQYSPERQSSQAVNIREFEMPLVLSADQAAGVAEVLQYVPWLERTPMQFRLGPEHLDLEPADVITIDAPYGQFPVRLDSIKYGPNGVLECTARPNAPAIWTPNAAGGKGVIPDGEVGLAADTVIELMDIPLIRDADDQPGFAAAMAGTTDQWDGGVLFRSADNGQTWQDVQAWSAPVTMGYARNALTANDGYVIDRASQLQVDLIAGELESITEAQMLTGLHWVAYGADQRWELIRFANADLQADGSYILSTLIRGARGTEWATGLHQAGDAVVLLDDADVAGILTSVETLNLIMQWRGVSVGQDINEAQSVPFAYRGVNLRPLSAVHPVGSRNGDDWLLDATRRSRYTTSWWTTGVERPLGETLEAWEVDILDGVSVVRTLSSPSLPVTYDRDQQIEDWGGVIDNVSADFYQMSAVVGRGYPLFGSFQQGAGDPFWPFVISLMHFDGPDSSTVMSDVTGRIWAAQGNAQLRAGEGVFGSSALELDGSSWVTTASDSDFDLTTTDITIEIFARLSSFSAVNTVLARHTPGPDGGFWLRVYSDGQIRFGALNTSSSLVIDLRSASGAAVIDTWNHIAIASEGSTWRMFIDGILVDTYSYSGGINNAAVGLWLGRDERSANPMAGYLDELRITRGVARYTGNFTPPSAPFPNQ